MVTPGKSSSSRVRRRAPRPSRPESGDVERGRSARGDGAERWPLALALPLARQIEQRLRREGFANARVAGSVRRRKESIGDLNFLVAARRPAAAFGMFASLPEVAQIYGRGRARTRVRLRSGIDADLHVVPEASFGSALIVFTGSEAHHRALRKVARRKKLELNEYGLFRGERMIAGRTEAEVYRALGLAFVPPELREDASEIDAARNSMLPPLIEHGDLRGDLRVCCDAGSAIEAMARAAAKSGLEYLCITSRLDGRRARATDAARVAAHVAAIRAHGDRWPGLRLLAGAEVAIRNDGSLAIEDAVLAQFDVVTAAVRDHFDQPRAQMTRRILRAMENPHVDLLVHPAMRPIAGREPVVLDMDAVIGAAKRTGTVLEIEASADRPGLPGEEVRKVVGAGVRLAIDSGAREPEQLASGLEFGISLARRGWARRSDVVNALPVWQCLWQLKGGRRR